MRKMHLRLMWSGLYAASMAASLNYVCVGVQAEELLHFYKVQDVKTGELSKRYAQETISGRGFLAIQAAMPELKRRGLKLDGYRIIVQQMGDSLFVLFRNPHNPEDGPMGTDCPGPRPCVTVELSADDLRVLRVSDPFFIGKGEPVDRQ